MIAGFGGRDEVPKMKPCPKCGIRMTASILEEHVETHISKVLPWLFLGNSANASNRVELFERNSIKRIVNCTTELKNYFPDDAEYFNLYMRDSWEQDMDLARVIPFIREARDCGQNVFVHCVQGASRSVAVVLAFLMIEEEMVLRHALEVVRAVRRIAKPNPNFTWQLIEIEEKKFGGASIAA
jgi:protein-tyrosine phosphatase